VKEYGVKFSTSNNFPSDATTTLTFEGTPGNSVTASLSGLSPSTHYYYCWYATTGNIVVRSEYGEFTTTATAKPQFSELEVDSIGENYVRLRCRVTEIGDQYLVEQGVSYRAKSNAAASFIPVTAESIDGNNEFTVAIEDLTAATTYEVRPYAKNSADAEGESGMLEGYGETQTFTTDDKLSPELETYDATDVTMNSARVLAKVTAAEGSYGVITERGFCYSTSSQNPTIYDKTVTVVGLTLGEVYEATLTDLAQLTTYYVRPYAKNLVNWTERVGYGTAIEFTTERSASPQVSLTGQDDVTVTATSITLQAQIDNYYPTALKERGFIWSTDDRNISIDNAKTAGNSLAVTATDKVFSGTLKDLTPGTNYYIRAYAIYQTTDETLSGLSEAVSYSTNDISGGTFKDISCTAKSSTTLTVETGISDMGEGTFVEKGFCWKDASRGTPTINNCDGSSAVSSTDNYTYSAVINGLEQGTTYIVRGYLKSTYNDQTLTSYSDALTCATNDFKSAKFGFVTATFANDTTISVSGGITDLGNGELTEKGYCWKIDQAPTLDDCDGSQAVSTGSNENYTATISSLHYNTTYYIRAYAKTKMGDETLISYSGYTELSTNNIISYTLSLGEDYVDITLSCLDDYKNNISEWSAAIIKEGDTTITVTDESYTVADEKNVVHLTGLKTATTYTVRIRAKHKDGYYIYQDTKSFSSLRGPSKDDMNDPDIKE
jgi:hypothetical protein